MSVEMQFDPIVVSAGFVDGADAVTDCIPGAAIAIRLSEAYPGPTPPVKPLTRWERFTFNHLDQWRHPIWAVQRKARRLRYRLRTLWLGTPQGQRWLRQHNTEMLELHRREGEESAKRASLPPSSDGPKLVTNRVPPWLVR